MVCARVGYYMAENLKCLMSVHTSCHNVTKKPECSLRAIHLMWHPNDDPQREDTVAEYDPQLEPEVSISEIRSPLSRTHPASTPSRTTR